jgi:hypothetical protein
LILLCQGFIYEDESNLETWVSVLIQTLVVSMILASLSHGIWVLVMTLLRKKSEVVFVDFSSFRYFDEATRMEILLIHALYKSTTSNDAIDINVDQLNQVFKTGYSSTENAQISPALELNQAFQRSLSVSAMADTVLGPQSNAIHQALRNQSIPQHNWDALVEDFLSFIKNHSNPNKIAAFNGL